MDMLVRAPTACVRDEAPPDSSLPRNFLVCLLSRDTKVHTLNELIAVWRRVLTRYI